MMNPWDEHSEMMHIAINLEVVATHIKGCTFFRFDDLTLTSFMLKTSLCHTVAGIVLITG